ncbi:sigma-70 family RNA polymerase sigma factor [Cytobacillus sp. FSL R7-0696]|uniref:sigma-70 family RNA polymerase sigma factor n=1 Tax=Cytobacillus sp. FSL R7-0696 TaxID=2921691 RepID=UPI0030FAA1D0
MDERSLIKRAIKGDMESLEELLLIHSDQLYRTAYLYVQNREDALDVVQEASYKAFIAIEQLKQEKYFLTWLTRILIHCAYSVLKKRNKEVRIQATHEIFKQQHEPTSEALLDLLDVIRTLKEKQKHAIILFYFHDLTINEISKVMKIPEGTVKTYLRRGKEKLKEKLGGDYYDEGKRIPRSL